MTIHSAILKAECGCDGYDKLAPLIGFDEALGRIAAQAKTVGRTEAVSLADALGRVLAHPVRSRALAPAFDNAAMDGYALDTSTLIGAGPWDLRVVARLAAGQTPAAPLSGPTAARIFTGAPVPAGADAVVMQEAVLRTGETVRLFERPAPGLNIRRAGSDIAAGATVLDAGRKLGPRDIAACAAAGAGVLSVRRRVRAALLVTGDEVRRAGGARDAGQIWDINTPMLSAFLGLAGVEIVRASHGDDDRDGLARQIEELATSVDLIVTTGGLSVGDEDHVKPALATLGGDIVFSGVAVKPGKPVSFGRIGSAFWLGLPGNPLSAYVTWALFGTALVRGLTGETGLAQRRHVVIATAIRRKPGRCELRPATLAGFDGHGREVVHCDDTIDSGRVGHLPSADGLIFLPADTDVLPAGALVEFQPFCPN